MVFARIDGEYHTKAARLSQTFFMEGRYSIMAKTTFSVPVFSLNNDGFMNVRTRVLARPANVIDVPAFARELAGVQLTCLYIKQCTKYANAYKVLNNDKSTAAARSKARNDKNNVQRALVYINRAIDKYDAAYDFNAPYTIAYAVAYAIFPACRGKLDKDNVFAFEHENNVYNAAVRAWESRGTNAAYAAARKDLHNAVLDFIEINTRNDGGEFSRKFAAKVKKDTIDAIIANVAATRTSYGANGIKSRVMTRADWTRELMLLALRDTFKFEDVLTPAPRAMTAAAMNHVKTM